MTVNRDEALDLLAADPASAGVMTDFDGSLAPIVLRPEDAHPVPGAEDTLAALAKRFALVAVVSGRALADLERRFHPEGVLLCGTYGRERSDRRGAQVPESQWDELVLRATAVTHDLPGVVVEPKAHGIAIHYRLAPDCAARVEAVGAALADQYGLQLRPGRQVIELMPAGAGKAETVETLVHEWGVRTVLFAGDDVADVEAFVRLRAIAVTALLVAVVSEESPSGLRELADIVLPRPEALHGLFAELAARI